jgi:hypothetical protein
MVHLAVVDSGAGQDFEQYFRIVEPSCFGTIVDTPQGPFVEAFFDNLHPEDVWIIIKTLQQGTRIKVNMSRRLADKPVFHYLKRGSRYNENNIELHGVKVGLPYEPKTPFQNIEVVVERKNGGVTTDYNVPAADQIVPAALLFHRDNPRLSWKREK